MTKEHMFMITTTLFMIHILKASSPSSDMNNFIREHCTDNTTKLSFFFTRAVHQTYQTSHGNSHFNLIKCSPRTDLLNL